MPRLLPEGLTLVKANARVSLAGVVGAIVSAPLAVGASAIGPEWSLRYAFLMFVLATIWAIRLPQQVDSAAGEGTIVLRGSAEGTSHGRARARIPAAVAFALRANCGPRWLTGFLTMFMAFLLREEPIGDYSPELLLALVIGGVGLGNTLGIFTASLLRRLNPTVTVVLALLADTALVLVAAAVLRPAGPGAARPHRRAGPVAGQGLARRDHPARRRRAHAVERVRPQRHDAPAGVGDRRLRRDRDAAGAPARAGRGHRRAGRLGGVRDDDPAAAGAAYVAA